MIEKCNFKHTRREPIQHDHKPTTWTEPHDICQLKQLGDCDGEENCILIHPTDRAAITREKDIKSGVIFNTGGYCLTCSWHWQSDEGCDKCRPHKEEERAKFWTQKK